MKIIHKGFILLAFIGIFMGCSKVMTDPVSITISGALSVESRLLIDAKTNLPEGTNLVISLEDVNHKTTLGSAKTLINSDGIAVFDPIGPINGIVNGDYSISITMPVASTQSATVQKIIGTNGEYLHGDLVKESELGKFVEYHAVINVADSPINEESLTNNSEASSENEQTTTDDKWWGKGNLHNSTVRDWKEATFENKLGTAADFLSATIWKEHLNSYEDFDKLKIKATILVSAIDDSLLNDNSLDSMKINEIVAAILTMSNDLGPE